MSIPRWMHEMLLQGIPTASRRSHASGPSGGTPSGIDSVVGRDPAGVLSSPCSVHVIKWRVRTSNWRLCAFLAPAPWILLHSPRGSIFLFLRFPPGFPPFPNPHPQTQSVGSPPFDTYPFVAECRVRDPNGPPFLNPPFDPEGLPFDRSRRLFSFPGTFPPKALDKEPQ